MRNSCVSVQGTRDWNWELEGNDKTSDLKNGSHENHSVMGKSLVSFWKS